MPAELEREEREPEGGPEKRIEQFMEERFPRIGAGGKETQGQEQEAEEPGVERFASRDLRRLEEPPRNPLPSSFRRDLVREYRRRQMAKLTRQGRRVPGAPALEEAGEGDMPEPPAPPPANNWIPIGPSVLRGGQAAGTPAVAGRVSGLAVARGGARVYAGSANGGVWRSDDGGRSWRSMMDAFDLNPTGRTSDSLACGAIAIDPNNPDHVYVGTGEGDSAFVRQAAGELIVDGSGAYFGVGPIRSVDGGQKWFPPEDTAPGSPKLEGAAFYALAVDPDPNAGDRVVGATINGLYRRELAGSSEFHWARKAAGIFTSVVAARAGGATTFYAAQWGGGVLRSNDGDTWGTVGTGFPTTDVGRIGLGVRPTDPSVIYALIAQASNRFVLGLWRLDLTSGAWRRVSGHPGDLFGNPASRPKGQGSYDLAIAVDPNNPDHIYLGGSTRPSGAASGADASAASLFRCTVAGNESGDGLTMSFTPIGERIHADIHALMFSPGDSEQLYVGCDGGVFFTGSASSASAGSSFVARNTGMQTLHMEHLGQHPTEDAVLFCGTQDNGTVRFTGEEAWLHSAPGDGGFAVVNWHDPYRVLVTYPNGIVRRSCDGGNRYSYTAFVIPPPQEPQLFYGPLAGTAPNPTNPIEAERVAFGTNRVWISDTFGSVWASIPNGDISDRLGEGNAFLIRSLAFAGANRIYAGLWGGRVYRYDRTETGWAAAVRIDSLGGSSSIPDTLTVPVTDIAVDHFDPDDPAGDSIYITLGNTRVGEAGDYRHVWHWDGTQWEQRSGPAAGDPEALLEVQANAIAVDPDSPDDLYVGADIGIWHSPDAGATWEPFSEGLPDAAVFDLQLHAPRRLLRASTHGRGVFERNLNADTQPGVELYIRDTQLDQGRFATVDGLLDPTRPGVAVTHDRGPDIKLDTPNDQGSYQFPLTSEIDFLQFVDVLVDDAQRVATHATAVITTRVYVQVHNRGVTPANGIRVMLLLASASAGPPPLPPDFASNLQSGTPISTSSWRTVGFATLDAVRVGFPKIAAFDLTSDLLPTPDNLAGNDRHCVLALVHQPDDPFTAIETATDLLSINERKVALKTLTVMPFVGTLPTS